MKFNKLTALATTTALVSMSFLKTSAQADSSNFSGGFASVGVSGTTTDVNLENNASNIPADEVGDSSATLVTAFTGFETSATTIIGRAKSILSDEDSVASAELTLGYNIPVSDKFLIGLDVTANSGGVSNSKTSNYTQATISGGTDADDSSVKIVGAAATQTTTYEEDETYSIGIRPSYAVNDKTMIYSRLSYGQTKATLKTAYSLAADSTAAKSVSDDLESYGAGVGAVYNTDRGFFVDVSLNYRKTEKLQNKIDDSAQTATLASLELTSATDHLTTKADAESYAATIKIGKRF